MTSLRARKAAVRSWAQGHPWSLTYIAFIATLNVILQLVLR